MPPVALAGGMVAVVHGSLEQFQRRPRVDPSPRIIPTIDHRAALTTAQSLVLRDGDVEEAIHSRQELQQNRNPSMYSVSITFDIARFCT